MNLIDYLSRLFGAHDEGPHVELYCPHGEGMTDETRIATEETDPDYFFDESGGHIAVYKCRVCGGQHRFLWGPPSPVYLGDVSGTPPENGGNGANGGTA